MKILKYIMALAAVCCVALIAYLKLTQKHLDDQTIRVFWSMPENLIINVCSVAAALLVGSVALMSLVEKVRKKEGGKALMIVGTVMCYGLVGLIFFFTKGDLGYLMHEIKSPDGDHSIYYMNDTRYDEVRWFRKVGDNEYNYFWFTYGQSTDCLDWKEKALSIEGHDVIYEWLDNWS